jgi:hypothetical protein
MCVDTHEVADTGVCSRSNMIWGKKLYIALDCHLRKQPPCNLLNGLTTLL